MLNFTSIISDKHIKTILSRIAFFTFMKSQILKIDYAHKETQIYRTPSEIIKIEAKIYALCCQEGKILA